MYNRLFIVSRELCDSFYSLKLKMRLLKWSILIVLLFVCIQCHEEHHQSHGHEHMDHHHHVHHHHEHEHEHEPVGPPQNTQCTEGEGMQNWSELFIPLSNREPFWHGILATTFIGCAPILCIKFVSTEDYYLKTLLAFASGGLMGDVFLHLLPTASSLYNTQDNHQHNEHDQDDEHDGHDHDHQEHGHSHNEGYTLLGMHILIGFLIFFILEKIFHEFGHSHNDKHSHNHNALDKEEIDKEEIEARQNAITILSICADASHNFTDGLTIAASFLISFRMGIIQTFSILLHEIPHEIGDYAILIENGVSIQMAMFVQFLTAIACLIGTITGFALDQHQQIGTRWIIPFTAGGFIYISCVQVLPTLVETKYGKIQSLFHVIFFIFGIAMMILVGYVEENAHHFVEYIEIK